MGHSLGRLTSCFTWSLTPTPMRSTGRSRDVIKKLIAAGVPAEQIAAIGDAESDAKKQALFEKVSKAPSAC